MIDTVAGWLAQKENYQWLDFGDGNQQVTCPLLKVMVRRESNLYRVFTADEHDTPVGLVVFSNISPNFRTAMVWYVLGDKRVAGHGYTSRAVSEMLTWGFSELGLRCINAWVVDQNIASIRVLQRNNFRLIGRLRQSHELDGRTVDRLLFDLLDSEHRRGYSASVSSQCR
ncbi:MAG: GNAT family N-acetyltransferase [Candidatus Binatia bacterium]